MDLSQPVLVDARNVILLPDTDEFREIAGAADAPARALCIKGHDVLAMRNAPAINHVLWAAGWQLPSPLYNSGYDWSMQTPFVSQIETAGMIIARRRSFVLSDLGVGKTLAALLAMDWLLLHGHVEKVLVVAPLSILRHIWEDEIRKRMFRLNPIVVHGSMAKRRQMLNSDGWNVAIINFDGVRIMADELVYHGFGMVVIDELATLRNHKSKTWKGANKLVRLASVATGLTGSPTPNGPWDAYGQIRLMVPDRVRTSFTNFRADVGIQVNEHLWKPKQGSTEYVYERMQPAVRFRRKDVIELKDIHHHTLTCDLSEDQAEFIKVIKTDLLVQYDAGLVIAANAAVLAGKLLQAAGGAVYTADRKVVDLKAIDRLIQADALIEAAAGKVIMLVPFRHIGELAVKTLRGTPFNRRDQVLWLRREMPQSERDRTLSLFKDERHQSRVLISHPALMSHGLNLTVADTIIWYMPTTSTERYQQANGRITRAGQDREQMLYHLRATTSEDKVYNTLATNGNMQQTLLELFETKFE